ncbi:GntR family transcriptional regulator [Ancylobacter mangrovi]|uniref:GntR family transcriptional regulator n=1 Tax=Ancylobacter mangrovi TaxID=2972472 RepID=UPI002162885F|nr:GntR family transcriptional regulator [Ancylobacter mangrovi]MCS0503680.1 GntR family transcriptional regulator [Ancylobacter mangrovi]
MAKRRKDEIASVLQGAALPENAADTLTNTLRQAIKRDVLTAALEPGARLSVRALAERYGVGATPVREALWCLVGEGLVVAEAQHGFQVSGADSSRLVHLLLLRRRVEPWLLAAAMRNGGPEWLRRVERAFTDFQPFDAQVGDLRPQNVEWERLHREFHLSLVEGSGMPAMVDLARRWYDEIDRYRRINARSLSVDATGKPDHEAMFELVTKGDQARAVATLTRHIDDTAERHMVTLDDADVRLTDLTSD